MAPDMLGARRRMPRAMRFSWTRDIGFYASRTKLCARTFLKYSRLFVVPPATRRYGTLQSRVAGRGGLVARLLGSSCVRAGRAATAGRPSSSPRRGGGGGRRGGARGGGGGGGGRGGAGREGGSLAFPHPPNPTSPPPPPPTKTN